MNSREWAVFWLCSFLVVAAFALSGCGALASVEGSLSCAPRPALLDTEACKVWRKGAES